jgi:hypothetical protein
VHHGVHHGAARPLAALNALNESIHGRMSLNAATAAPEYIITRTRFRTPTYDGAIAPILERLGVAVDEWKAASSER